ncbi:unnamed protein product [Malus baccata var. baccata]
MTVVPIHSTRPSSSHPLFGLSSEFFVGRQKKILKNVIHSEFNGPLSYHVLVIVRFASHPVTQLNPTLFRNSKRAEMPLDFCSVSLAVSAFVQSNDCCTHSLHASIIQSPSIWVAF